MFNIPSFQGTVKAAADFVTPSADRTSAHAANMFPVRRSLTASRAFFSPSFLSAARQQTLCSDRRVFENPNRKTSGERCNVPPSAEFVARVSGIPTMAKLPYQDTADGLDAAFVGVPIDTGTSNRPGARCGFFFSCAAAVRELVDLLSSVSTKINLREFPSVTSWQQCCGHPCQNSDILLHC